MKRFLPFFLLFLLSCSGGNLQVDDSRKEVNNLNDFFNRSGTDAQNAAGVLVKHRIIQHLTHLRRMNAGGRKYYLLEKDHITEMINSVTKGIYLDYIIINRHGNIIYTRNNDDLFGQNVNEGYEETPLKNCFSNSGSPLFFNDVATLSPGSSVYSLYASIPVNIEGNFHGILILQIDIARISELLKPSTDVVSREGLIRVSTDGSKILSKYKSFEKINSAAAERGKSGLLEDSGRTVLYSPFQYRNISWLVFTDKK